MTRLADRSMEIVLRNRVLFGVGALERLPEAVAAAGGARAFVVTDPGVRGSGVIDRVLAILAAADVEASVFAGVEPNPGASTVERGAEALRTFGLGGTVVVPVGGGSSMDTAKALDLRATNDQPLWELEYDGPDLAPGRPVVAVPTTAGTGAETNSFAVITDEGAGRKGYIGHPSLLPVTTILDPALTLGLPPAATAATGIDAMTHSLESLLSANPNPFAEAMALGVIRTIGTWLRACGRGRHGHRGAIPDADGLASGRCRAGQRHGCRPRPRAGPFDRDARGRRPRHGARGRPARGPALLPRDARPRARAGRDRARGRRRAPSRMRPPRPSRSARSTSCSATSTSAPACGASAWPTMPPSTGSSPTPSTTRPSATRRGCRPRSRRARSSRPSPADGPADQPRSGTTSPMNRSRDSVSYGAGCSEMNVRKPSSTYGRIRSAISSGVPFQNV